MLGCLLLGVLPSRLDAILADPKLEGAVVSATVCRLDGTPIYEKNSRTHVVPASNQKLLSAAFALFERGPDYRPTTSFWKLPDRLVIETTGDPLLSYGQLMEARKALRLRGDLPVWVNEPWAPGIPDTWEFDDLPNKYAAPITAFTVDRGSFELWWKGKRLVAVPNNYHTSIRYAGGTGAVSVRYDPFEQKIVVSGKLPEQDKRLDTLSILHPDKEAALLLGNRFERTSETPRTAPDYVITGKPLGEIVAACLPPSDNNIAENLLLIGARAEGELGEQPYRLARQRLGNFLTRVVGVPVGEVKPYDGSGMSRHNFVTTHALAQLLIWADKQLTSSVWHAAIAQSGKPGTLAKRLIEVPFQGKTGTLDMVVALSGYIRHKTGENLIASVIFNQFGCSSAEAEQIEDAFMREVATADLPAKEGK